MLIYFSIFILLLLSIYFAFRFVIFTKTQKDKTCRICNSKDTERVARNAVIKKILLSKNVYKYWCRKCGNNFYHKNTSY